VAAPTDTAQLAASRRHSRCIRALTVFDLRKPAGHRVSSWSGAGYRDGVLGAGWTEAVAFAAAFVISAIATPAGVSRAVLLLPFQVSVTARPAVQAITTQVSSAPAR